MEEVEVKSNCSTFSLFPNLPPELRNQIWRHALDRDIGLCLYGYKKGCWCPRELSVNDEGYDPEHPDDNTVLEFRYDLLGEYQMEMPVAFANKEAQGAAISWAEKQDPPIRTRVDGHQLIFLRAFNPERDTVYVAWEQWDDFLREPYERPFSSDLVEKALDVRSCLTRIAVLKPLLEDTHRTISELFENYWNIRVLYILVDTPSNFYEQARLEAISEQRLCECRSPRRVALLTRGKWEFNFTDVDEGEFRTLVESVTQGLCMGLEIGARLFFEIYSVPISYN
ncbi:hypothetical protein F4805DRAFT_46428 [Annulohypoxylon moriforme]|nr:hypothetical protein F4805DRAFT_46428 [Annulohypoxylon moriforme]